VTRALGNLSPLNEGKKVWLFEGGAAVRIDQVAPAPSGQLQKGILTGELIRCG
jgi:hypothetical protein